MEKDIFFNEEIKEKFLSKFPEESRNTYSYVFRKSKEMEELIERDLYDFTLNQIGKLLKLFKFKTGNAAKTYGRIISSYINWANENNLKCEDNPLKHIGSEWFEQYVSENKLLFTEDEIIQLENDLVNYQDKALIRCLFEGISGHNLSELSNLHKKDIEWDNYIVHLKDEKSGTRTIKVSQRCIEFLRVALRDTEYQKSNGNSTAKSPILSLVESNYVFKNANTSSERDNQSVDKHTFYRKLTQISKWFELSNLTTKNIINSGKVKMALDLYNDNGRLENEELAIIAEQFGLRKVMINGYETYNYFVMRQTINFENIENLYGK